LGAKFDLNFINKFVLVLASSTGWQHYLNLSLDFVLVFLLAGGWQ
jgi:hypothetical protein